MKNLTYFLVGLTVIVGAVVLTAKPTELGNIQRSNNAFSVAQTNSSVHCNSTSTLALASSSNRSYAYLANDGAAVTYLSLNETGATTSQGIILAPKTSSTLAHVEFGENHIPYFGSIYCIGSTTLTIVQN